MREIQLPPLSAITSQGGIYVVWLSDSHYYGGRAINFRARWRRHLTQLEQGKHLNKHMQAVFNKYREFSPEILSVLPLKEQIQAEEAWLAEHFGKKDCLNLSRSARNNTHLSPEARRKISLKNKGRKQSIDSIRRSSESRKGMRMPEETRRKLSEIQTGKKHSKEARENMSKSSFLRGKPISNKLRSAIVESNQRRKGEKRSSELKAHISSIMSRFVWVCHEGQCRRVLPSESELLLEQGWQKGRKYKPC